jgi:hypothetical protein
MGSDPCLSSVCLRELNADVDAEKAQVVLFISDAPGFVAFPDFLGL